MSNDKKKNTPPAFDLRDLVREVLATAREESAQESRPEPEAKPQGQPNQP